VRSPTTVGSCQEYLDRYIDLAHFCPFPFQFVLGRLHSTLFLRHHTSIGRAEDVQLRTLDKSRQNCTELNTMILGPINGIDCIAFVLFLIPQLVLQVDWFSLCSVLFNVIPFLGRVTIPLCCYKILTSLCSLPATVSTGTGAIFRKTGEPVTIHSACKSIPGCGHTLR